MFVQEAKLPWEEFDFVPRKAPRGSISIDLVLNVSLNAKTRSSPTKGVGRDVVVSADGIVHGQAVKNIVLTSSGLSSSPASFKTHSGKLVLRGVRAGGLLAGLKRRVATKEFYKSRGQELAKAKQELRGEVIATLDKEVDAIVEEINRDYKSLFNEVLYGANNSAGRLTYSSDENGLKIMMIANKEISAKMTKNDLVGSQSEKAYLQANDLFLQSYLNELLSNKTIKAKELIGFLQTLPIEGVVMGENIPKLDVESSELALDPTNIQLTFRSNPVKVSMNSSMMSLLSKQQWPLRGISISERIYTVSYGAHNRRGAPYLDRVKVKVELENKNAFEKKSKGFSLLSLGAALAEKVGDKASSAASAQVEDIMKSFKERIDLPRNIPLYRVDINDMSQKKIGRVLATYGGEKLKWVV